MLVVWNLPLYKTFTNLQDAEAPIGTEDATNIPRSLNEVLMFFAQYLAKSGAQAVNYEKVKKGTSFEHFLERLG